MSVLIVPEILPDENVLWPSLGPQLWDWQMDHLVYGPGDLRGTYLRDIPPDAEYRSILHRAYQVHPLPEDVAKRAVALQQFDPDDSGLMLPQEAGNAGRRRFKRVALSVRKGTAKTEKAAWIALGELHPTAPVRTIGWTLERGEYVPVGGSVRDPFIPLVAFTEEQTEELAYGAMRTMVEEAPELHDYLDPGAERIMRRDGNGKAVALASSPDSTDGARTTFQNFDETHRLVLPRLVAAHQTMQANIPKRKLADAWSLETTTAYTPGEGSVAEGTMAYAEKVREGKIADSRLFFFHRQAGDHFTLNDDTTPETIREAVAEASGPAAGWSDLDSIVAMWQDPQTDRRYFERVWLNRLVQASGQAFDVERLQALKGTWAPSDWTEDFNTNGFRPVGERWLPPRKSTVVLGFDGSRVKDATALVGIHVETARMFTLGVWERPPRTQSWEVPFDEVDAAVTSAFTRWDVWRMYADPPYWETAVSAWSGRFGKFKGRVGSGPRVFEWWTNRTKQMALALKAYQGALAAGDFTHDAHPLLVAHHGHARREDTNHFDEDDDGRRTDKRLYVIRKERPDSPLKIDAAMAAVLAWEAYRDAVAIGVAVKRSRVPRSF